MSRYVDLPSRGHLPAVSLLARISTPLNRSSTIISPNHPTILLCHPIWTDSFFFYPQYDEPALYENYNLISFDIRGHGDTLVEPSTRGLFSWWDAADDAYLALRELGVEAVHLLGASLGSHVALRMAQRYPGFVVSATLVNPATALDPPGWSEAFNECKQLLDRAIDLRDEDALDDVTIGGWGIGLGDTVTGPVKDLRQRFMDHQRTKLAEGKLEVALPYLTGLLETRRDVIAEEDWSDIACPVLIVTNRETVEGDLKDEYERLVRSINQPKFARLGISRTRSQATLITLDEIPRWITLAAPHVLHPLWMEHIEAAFARYIASSPPSPLSTTFSRSSRTSLSSLCSGRRRSSPREMTGFDIPPPPKLGPGILTLGQVLDREKAEGIPMTVEVVVTVDGGREMTHLPPS